MDPDDTAPKKLSKSALSSSKANSLPTRSSKYKLRARISYYSPPGKGRLSVDHYVTEEPEQDPKMQERESNMKKMWEMNTRDTLPVKESKAMSIGRKSRTAAEDDRKRDEEMEQDISRIHIPHSLSLQPLPEEKKLRSKVSLDMRRKVSTKPKPVVEPEIELRIESEIESNIETEIELKIEPEIEPKIESEIETEEEKGSSLDTFTFQERRLSSDEASVEFVEQDLPETYFRISDADLSELMSKPTTKLGKIGLLKGGYMTVSEFEKVVNKLYKCCLKGVTDLHELHRRRLLAVPIIGDIITRADPEYISTAHVIHMIWSVMSCMHHFQLRLRSGSNKFVMYTRQRMVDKCMNLYLHLIRMFKPKMHRFIMSAIITFFKEGKLWDVEFACTEMIASLLQIYTDVEDGVNELLNAAISSAAENALEAQKLMQIIYEVLREVELPRISRELIDRLLYILESSISPMEDTGHIYLPLRGGIDLCIRHLINNINNSDVIVVLKRMLKKMVSDSTPATILSFANLACYAAGKYHMKSFYNNITPDILFNLSILTHQPDATTFKSTIRVWVNLIDRNKNNFWVQQPKIFLRHCNYNLKLRKSCNNRDKKFFKIYRNYFYDLIIDCFKMSSSRIQINAIFEMCALMLIEIPCGYTAATLTSVAMTIQEYALNITSDRLVKSHYLHATALSILTLICYIHKAEVFYQYVTNIIERRAEWAPHLIPPLKAKYEYAIHHILWNKPDLFFEDWETRFGLWKCFRIRKERMKRRKV